MPLYRLAMLAVLALARPAFAADSPEQALADVPPLPKAAAKDLACSAGDKLGARMQQVMQAQAPALQAAGMAGPMGPRTVNQAQIAAMQSLNDPEFAACQQRLLQSPPALWIAPMKDKLQARLAAVEAAKEAADNRYCQTHPSEACIGDPDGPRRFNPQAAAAGTQLLDEARASYAKLAQDVAACVARREKIAAAARAAGLGPQFDAMLMGATQMDWALAGSVAGANAELCTAAHDAALTYLPQP